MMLGHEGVVRALTVRLRERLPAMVDRMRGELGVNEWELPSVLPERVHPTQVDVVGRGQFPIFMVTQDGTGIQQSTRQVDVSPDYDEYAFRYRCRVVFYATGDTPESTEGQRKRLLLALRQTLLSDRILLQDADTGESAVIDHGYLREQFSELAKDDAGKLLAGAYLELEVVTNEVLQVGFGGPAAVFGIRPEAVQDTPELP